MGISVAASKLKPVLLGAIALLVITQIVALMPSQLDQDAPSKNIDPNEILKENKPEIILATGIPNRIADYTVEAFKFASVQNGEKQWNIIARTAHLYNKEKLVHARDMIAYLYDSAEKITVVRGREAKYFMDDRNLEVFGDVVSKLPDGFETKSQYMRYLPKEKFVQVPDNQPVSGIGAQTKGEIISFDSFGLDFKMGSNEILLPKNVHFVLKRTEKDPDTLKDKDAETHIESDTCTIDRNRQVAQFFMDQNKPIESRFVLITEPDFFSKARRAEVNYGDGTKLLNYMVAYEDVLIKEKNKTEIRYGTGGQADFDSKKNIIILRKFPQVYQNNDTVTGDIIIVHRNTDTVEVENSNAFSEGKDEESDLKTESETKKASSQLLDDKGKKDGKEKQTP